MQKLILFITRFSVLLPLRDRTYEWAKTQDTFEQHKQKLFDIRRLSIRMRTFESLTVPSIRDQEIPENANAKIIHLVLTSTELPPEYMGQLEQLAAQYNHIQIIKINPGSQADGNDNNPRSLDSAIRRCVCKECSETQESILFATVRIDDDDALSKTYTKTLCSHLNPHSVGYVFSIPSGILCVADPDRGCLLDPRYWYFAKNAMGLAYFNKFENKNGPGFFDDQIFHIHNCGSHVDIDHRFPVILDSRTLGYLATTNGVNDSGDHKHMRFLPKASTATLASIFKDIPEIISMLPAMHQGGFESGGNVYSTAGRQASQSRALYLMLAHETRHCRLLIRLFRKLRDAIFKLKQLRE